MELVPVQPFPNQTLQVSLANQPVVLTIYQTAYALHVDVYVGNALIVAGVVAQNLNRIVRDEYLGFIGDLAFLDTDGTDDPVFTGLGSRFLLLYLEEQDLPAGN
jgi:hypothetical protein